MKTTVSNQQVHIAVQQYIQYTILCSHVATNSVLKAESVDTCCVCFCLECFTIFGHPGSSEVPCNL